MKENRVNPSHETENKIQHLKPDHVEWRDIFPYLRLKFITQKLLDHYISYGYFLTYFDRGCLSQ